MGRRFEPFVAQERPISSNRNRSFLLNNRGVAQPGRASALGAECRQFESGYPDTRKAPPRGAFLVYVQSVRDGRISSIEIVESEANILAIFVMCRANFITNEKVRGQTNPAVSKTPLLQNTD